MPLEQSYNIKPGGSRGAHPSYQGSLQRFLWPGPDRFREVQKEELTAGIVLAPGLL